MSNVFVQGRPVRYWDCWASCRSWGAALGSPAGLQGLTLAYLISVFFHLVLPVTSRRESRPSTLPILSYCPFYLVTRGTSFLAVILHYHSAMALHLHSAACLSLALSWGEDQTVLIILKHSSCISHEKWLGTVSRSGMIVPSSLFTVDLIGSPTSFIAFMTPARQVHLY